MTEPAGRGKATLASRPAGYPRPPLSDRLSPLSAGPVTTHTRRPPWLVVESPLAATGAESSRIERLTDLLTYGGSSSPDPCSTVFVG